MAGGAKRPRRTTTTTRAEAADVPPASRSRTQWESISDEALKLACLEVHLVTTWLNILQRSGSFR